MELDIMREIFLRFIPLYSNVHSNHLELLEMNKVINSFHVEITNTPRYTFTVPLSSRYRFRLARLLTH